MKFNILVGDLIMMNDGEEILVDKSALFIKEAEKYKLLTHGINFDFHPAGGSLYEKKPTIKTPQNKQFYVTNIVPHHVIKHYAMNKVVVRLRILQN